MSNTGGFSPVNGLRSIFGVNALAQAVRKHSYGAAAAAAADSMPASNVQRARTWGLLNMLITASSVASSSAPSTAEHVKQTFRTNPLVGMMGKGVPNMASSTCGFINCAPTPSAEGSSAWSWAPVATGGFIMQVPSCGGTWGVTADNPVMAAAAGALKVRLATAARAEACKSLASHPLSDLSEDGPASHAVLDIEEDDWDME